MEGSELGEEAAPSPGSPGPLLPSLPPAAIMDKSRLALCLVLCTVVLANPLAPLVADPAGLYETEGGAVGRSILGTQAASTLGTLVAASSTSLALSAFNILILIAGQSRIIK